MKRYGIALAIVAALVMCPYWPGHDMDDLRISVVSIAGILSLIWFVWQGGLSKKLFFAVPFFLWVIAQAYIHPVRGYAHYAVLPYIGALGIIALASKSPRGWVIAILVSCAAIQIVTRYFITLHWRHEYPLLMWGTVRNQIRYSVILFAGMGAFAAIKGWGRYIGIASLAALIVLAGSDSVLLVAGAIVFAVVFSRFDLKRAAAFAFASAAMVYFFAGDGMHLDEVRKMLWGKTIPYLSVTGRGVGAWLLDCGAIGLSCIGHPHNSGLKIIFEFGYVGAGLMLIMLALPVWVSIKSRLSGVFAVTCVLVFVQTLTNDLFGYQDVALMFLITYGAAINEAN